MDRFNKISDEELGAYLDGMLPDEESAKIDAAMEAVDEMTSDNIISMPSWIWGSAASVCSACSPPDAVDFISDASMDDDEGE